MDPAEVWRGPGYAGEPPPEPWPGRHDDFMAACAMFAGQREKELLSVIEAIGSAQKAPEMPKQRNPLRGPGS